MSKKYEFHALADVFPLIEGEEFDALVADIKKQTLLEPITIFEGKILDGRNRYRACLAAGVDPTFAPYLDDGPTGYVVSMNVRRRHLTADQKRDAITALLKADPTKSDRQIAKAAKASPTHVGKVRRELEAKADVSTVDTRTDTKGRKQPATKNKNKKPLRFTDDPCHQCNGTGVVEETAEEAAVAAAWREAMNNDVNEAGAKLENSLGSATKFKVALDAYLKAQESLKSKLINVYEVLCRKEATAKTEAPDLDDLPNFLDRTKAKEVVA